MGLGLLTWKQFYNKNKKNGPRPHSPLAFPFTRSSHGVRPSPPRTPSHRRTRCRRVALPLPRIDIPGMGANMKTGIEIISQYYRNGAKICTISWLEKIRIEIETNVSGVYGINNGNGDGEDRDGEREAAMGIMTNWGYEIWTVGSYFTARKSCTNSFTCFHWVYDSLLRHPCEWVFQERGSQSLFCFVCVYKGKNAKQFESTNVRSKCSMWSR